MSNEDYNNNNKQSKPVTIIVKRIAKKDKIKEFEEWLSGISREISRQEGMMGIDIIRPTPNTTNNKLCNNACFNKIIEILVIQDLSKSILK